MMSINSHLRVVLPEVIQDPEDVQFPLIALRKVLQDLMEPEKESYIYHSSPFKKMPKHL